MTEIKYIVIHCSDSNFGDVELIRDWHVNGRGWRDIGYNGVILNGHRRSKSDVNEDEVGLFEVGRGMDFDKYVDSSERGAHALGYNKKSLGICLIGVDKFRVEQFQTALIACAMYKRINPEIKIIGHYECEGTSKTCPNFEMIGFRELLQYDEFGKSQIEDVMGNYLV